MLWSPAHWCTYCLLERCRSLWSWVQHTLYAHLLPDRHERSSASERVRSSERHSPTIHFELPPKAPFSAWPQHHQLRSRAHHSACSLSWLPDWRLLESTDLWTLPEVNIRSNRPLVHLDHLLESKSLNSQRGRSHSWSRWRLQLHGANQRRRWRSNYSNPGPNTRTRSHHERRKKPFHFRTHSLPFTCFRLSIHMLIFT